MERPLVWLIDDEIDLAETYSDILSDTYETRTFAGAKEVLEAVTKGDLPDLFVTDINMPGMNGIELIRELRNRKIQKGIIIVSGYAEKEHAVQALQMGVAGLIDKPFVRAHFRHLVNRAISYTHVMEMNEELIMRSRELTSSLEILLAKARERYVDAETKLDDKSAASPVTKDQKEALLKHMKDVMEESKLEALIVRAKKQISDIADKREKLKKFAL